MERTSRFKNHIMLEGILSHIMLNTAFPPGTGELHPLVNPRYENTAHFVLDSVFNCKWSMWTPFFTSPVEMDISCLNSICQILVNCSWLVWRGVLSRPRDSSETYRTRWASRSKSRSQIQDVSSLALYRRRIPNRTYTSWVRVLYLFHQDPSFENKKPKSTRQNTGKEFCGIDCG